MKSKILLATGLLLVCGSMIVARYVLLPDFLRGGMMGVGLALEMLGLGMMRKKVC